MSYTPYYTANFTNELEQEVEITISKKDGDVVTIENYEVSECVLNDSGEDQTKYSCIIARDLTLSLFADLGSGLTWETFITAEHDEWFVLVTIDSQKYFEGFITPDEGNALFQDKPYEVVIKATNGLALIKDVPLVKIDGSNFTGDNKLIDYIAAALYQTGLQLPIRSYINYFLVSMENRGNDLGRDMLQQTYLNYRSFQKDPLTFISCYDTLKFILDHFCTIEYWNGCWQITNIAEKQYLPGDWFYTDYAYDGSSPIGAQVTDNYAQVGKTQDIFPVNENQQVFSRFAVKSAKSSYNYNIWPELPLNNKFERGTIIIPLGGPTTKAYTIDDWTYGGFSSVSPLPSLSATTDTAYRLSTFDAFNIEKSREILLNKSDLVTKFLQSEGVPVNAGDLLDVDVNFKLNFDLGGDPTIGIMSFYIIDSITGHKWSWENRQSVNINRWVDSTVGGALLSLDLSYTSEQTSVYKTLTATCPPLPVSGTMYVVFVNSVDSSLPNTAYFSQFNLTYKPYVFGGYQQVKGDYWIRSQNKVFPDVIEDVIEMSDSRSRVFQGALIFKNESVDILTLPQWYRFGTLTTVNPLSEARHFKELLNIGRFNNSYRRMYAVMGDFEGLNYAPQNNPDSKEPLGFHKNYRFTDITPNRDFVLVPPMSMDLMTGVCNLSFVEVHKDSDDGTQSGDSATFNYSF